MTLIRQRAVEQYLHPLSTACMHRLAETVCIPPERMDVLETMLAELIAENRVRMRIDCEQRVPYTSLFYSLFFNIVLFNVGCDRSWWPLRHRTNETRSRATSSAPWTAASSPRSC